MTKGVKVGDTGTDHDGFPPTPVTAGSPNVNFDGQPAARVGDPLAPHSKPKHPLHGRSISSGSSTVFINGKPAAITGGAISCGGVTVGSGTVNIGDKYQLASFSGLSPSEPSENKLGISSEYLQIEKGLSQGLTEEDKLIQEDTPKRLLERILQSEELKDAPKFEQMAGGEKILYRKESKGEEVKHIQQGLIKLGYDLGWYGADGYFGSTTERRTKEFQNAYQPSHKTHANYKVGVADGIVGRNTLLALDEALVENWIIHPLDSGPIQWTNFIIKYEIVFEKLNSTSKDNLNKIIKSVNDYIARKGSVNLFEMAYMLATARHEAYHFPTGEYFSSKPEVGNKGYFNKYDPVLGETEILRKRAIKMGNTEKGDGFKFRGRGLVHLTWKKNYQKASDSLGVNFVDEPDLAANVKYSVSIMIWGMQNGVFTGRKLSDYINKENIDYVRARKVINGNDKAELISSYAKKFQEILEGSSELPKE